MDQVTRRLLNKAQKQIKTLKEITKRDVSKKFNIPIGTGEIMNTNFCHISICKSRFKNKILILSAIDNLIKGGAGQAVQNLNLIYGFNKALGLKK